MVIGASKVTKYQLISRLLLTPLYSFRLAGKRQSTDGVDKKRFGRLWGGRKERVSRWGV